MATTIIRPFSTIAQTGWDTSNIHTVIGDTNLTTSVVQNDSVCNFTGTLSNIDESLNIFSIQNFTISLVGEAGRAGTSVVLVHLIDSGGGLYTPQGLNFSGLTTTQTTSFISQQQDGSSALTESYLNGCAIAIAPDESGTTVYELFVTVNCTLSTTSLNAPINLTSGKIELTQGNITI